MSILHAQEPPQKLTLDDILYFKSIDEKTEDEIWQQITRCGVDIPENKATYQRLRAEGFSFDFIKKLKILLQQGAQTAPHSQKPAPHSQEQSQSPIPTYQGFTYLRTTTYACGVVTHTVYEYQHTLTGLEFVLIPGNTFMMGNELPPGLYSVQHSVALSPYLISKTEVTQAVWQKIMGSNPAFFKDPHKPVEQVSWQDCMEFCKKAGLSLPTEAQWECACRAGTKSKYYFGDDEAQLKEYAWYYGNSDNQTHPVAQKKSNAYGLYDMHGNVQEWCLDGYAAYPNTVVVDPLAPAKGNLRVYRGGSWQDHGSILDSARRFLAPSTFCPHHFGLRVVGPEFRQN